MENFTVFNPTQVFFGKNVINNLGKIVQQSGRNVLLIYGKGSVKKNGIYNDIINQLNQCGAKVTEYAGIRPNPITKDVNKAALLGRQNNIDVIIAAGGGSVIDSAKVVSVCICEPLDAWDVMKAKVKPRTSVPVIAVLTIAATGTEMNPYSVLQNPATKEKIGFGCSLMYPKYSFLDPQYTFSVPADYTAYGITDLIAHSLEAYFSFGKADLSDRFAESIIKEAMEIAPFVLKEPENYAYRSRMMWAATCALNGTASYGRSASGDWGVHDIGHTLSFLYDMPHGATLSIAYPAWLKLQKERIPERIRHLGKQIFGVNSADETIQKFEDFFRSIHSPVKLSDAGIGTDKKEEIVSLMNKNKATGFNHKLTNEDHQKIVELMY
ncbi:MAG: iron-containing alcohol dehydrogenase [Bacteroidia bacterium]|nr:iron-containing alcohol dehydrogenase [Bacteroidia bacterium]